MARKRTKPVEESYEVQQRRKRALELRLSGLNQTQIAEEMGLHKSTISAYIQDALADITRESAEQYLQFQLDQLDAMLSKVWPGIMAREKGYEWKIDRALAIIDQRARLTGNYKSAELKAIAAAKGTVSSETSSMIGRFFDQLDKIYEADSPTDDAAPDADEDEGE